MRSVHCVLCLYIRLCTWLIYFKQLFPVWTLVFSTHPRRSRPMSAKDDWKAGKLILLFKVSIQPFTTADYVIKRDVFFYRNSCITIFLSRQRVSELQKLFARNIVLTKIEILWFTDPLQRPGQNRKCVGNNIRDRSVLPLHPHKRT